MIEKIKRSEIPSKFEGRHRKFECSAVVNDALAQLSGLSEDEALRWPSLEVAHNNLHTQVKNAAKRANMRVRLTIKSDFTYLERMDE